MQRFKILTMNIHKGFAMGNRRFTLEKIKDCLREVDANIVFLQEVVGESRRDRSSIPNWPDNNQLEFLADTVWSHHAYGQNAIHQHGHHGNAILSEHPFKTWHNVDISFFSFSQRGVLHGVTVDGIHLLCVHLGLFERERRLQISKLLKYIEDTIPPDDAIILAGDFNDWRKQSHRLIVRNSGLQEVFHQQQNDMVKTFPAFRPILAMDRIYARGFSVAHCQVMTGQPWRALSDHCALLAELILSKEPSESKAPSEQYNDASQRV